MAYKVQRVGAIGCGRRVGAAEPRLRNTGVGQARLLMRRVAFEENTS